MPSISLQFSLIADSSGTVSASQDENPPTQVKLSDMTVRSTSGCRSRTHNVTGGFSGGATFSYTGTVTDCTDLFIDLNNLPSPAFTTTTLKFTLDGFDAGETVLLEGTLNYTVSLFGLVDANEMLLMRFPRVPRVNLLEIAQRPTSAEAANPVNLELATALEPARSSLFESTSVIPSMVSENATKHRAQAEPVPDLDLIPAGGDSGTRINLAKSLIFRWFSLYDIRSRQADQEILELLVPTGFEIKFPDATLHTPDEFRTWYRAHFPQVKRGYHEIHDIQVTLLDDTTCSVLLQPLLHAELPTGQTMSMAFTIQARLTESCPSGPKIQSYSAQPIAPG